MSEENKNTKQVKDLVSALESTTSLIQTLITDLKESSNAIGSLKSKVDNIEKEVKEMHNLLYCGDEPLLTKIALIARDVEDLRQDFERAMQTVSQNQANVSKQKWNLIGIIIAGLLGIIGSLITYFVSQGGS